MRGYFLRIDLCINYLYSTTYGAWPAQVLDNQQLMTKRKESEVFSCNY